MLVRVCNNCQARLKGVYLEGVGLSVVRDGKDLFEIEGVDFCSYACLKLFVEESLDLEDQLGDDSD